MNSTKSAPLSLTLYTGLLERYLRPLWRSVCVLSLLLLLDIALKLVIPQIMARFIDSVSAGSSLQDLTRLAVAYIGVALFQQITTALATYSAENVGWSATNALRTELAGHCLHLDLSFYNAHTPGEMIERIDGDVTTLSDFFSRFTIQVFGNALLAVGILVLLFRVDWRVGISISLFAISAFGVLLRFRDMAVPHFSAERQASADLFGFLEERLSGAEDIRANGGKDYVMRKFYALMRNLLQRSLRAGLMVNVLLNIMFILFAIGNAAAFAIGAYLFGKQALTLGTVYLVFQYTSMLERPIEDLARQLGELQKAGAGILRVQQLFGERSHLAEPGGIEAALPQDGPSETGASCPALGLSIEDVTFAYHDQKTSPVSPENHSEAEQLDILRGEAGIELEANPEAVLQDVRFQIEPGTVLGVLGRTGSGKTSLTRLIFRFYDPDSGKLNIFWREDLRPAPKQPPPGYPDPANGGKVVRDLQRLPLTTLRRMIGMIPQNVQLFNASIRDNLTFFDRSIPDERILQAIHDLGLGEWRRSLPKGLDTELESSGGGLSSGQAQLLAFTRIFLKEPGLVILDEASSRLDPATERLIEHAIDRLVQGRTAIIIAHRLATVQRADQILILENGRVKEFGRRTELAADPGSHFYSLLKTGLEEVLV